MSSPNLVIILVSSSILLMLPAAFLNVVIVKCTLAIGFKVR